MFRNIIVVVKKNFIKKKGVVIYSVNLTMQIVYVGIKVMSSTLEGAA